MTNRRLIEVELPLVASNKQSRLDKYLSRGHISALHRYWARRPLAMCRTIVAGSLIDDPDDPVERKMLLDDLAAALPFEDATSEARLRPLRERITRDRGGKPSVLDAFAGGGAIPLEALRLGCETTSLELNPVAFLMNVCALSLPQSLRDPLPNGDFRLSALVREWGHRVGMRAYERIRDLYAAPNGRATPVMYFWARTVACPDPSCGVEIPLLSSVVPPRVGGYWIHVSVSGRAVDLKVRTGSAPNEAAGTVRSATVTCPRCGASVRADELRAIGKAPGFGARLYAVAEPSSGRGRVLRDPLPGEEDLVAAARERLPEDDAFPEGSTVIPDEPCDPDGYRRVQSLVYGFERWRDLFNDRQLLALTVVCLEVRAAYEEMLSNGLPADEANAVATYLAMCVDRLADWNSSFCGEKNTFPRQAIRMLWDYVEINPFEKVGGNWQGGVDLVVSVIEHTSTIKDPACVLRGDVQHLPFEDRSFDAVIVDPPYYDSIQYSYLSDFFYVWLKRAVGNIHPSDFATPATPKTQEVLQSQAHKTSPAFVSREQFEARLDRAFAELARVIRSDGLVVVVFAHTDVAAWEYLLLSLRRAGLVVTTSWPMRSESESRSTAQRSAVLGSSVVLVCRLSTSGSEGFYDDVVRALHARIADRLDAFEEMGLVGADYFVSAIGPSFEVFAQHSRIVKLSGEEVDVSDLMVLARQAVAHHAMRRLLGAYSLAALDAESLFYVTWRWAYLSEAIPADEAFKLERAFDVDLGSLSRPGGFAKQAGSSFSLLGPAERKGIRLTASPSLIDVLHLACRLWDTSRRRELEELLGATGMGTEPGFWATARALAEVLPDGNRERTMLLGLTGNRDVLTEAAAKATLTVEELTLFELGGQ